MFYQKCLASVQSTPCMEEGTEPHFLTPCVIGILGCNPINKFNLSSKEAHTGNKMMYSSNECKFLRTLDNYIH